MFKITKGPARPIRPGQIIQRELDVRGWTQNDLAAVMGRPSQAISEIEQLAKPQVKTLPAFGAAALKKKIPELLKLSARAGDVAEVPAFLANLGIGFIVLPHLPKTYLDGAILPVDGHPVVALSRRYDRIDNFWFTLLHEIAHWVEGLRAGQSYISDGSGHLMDFARLADGSLGVNAAIRKDGAPPQEIELVVNGLPVAKQIIPSDGTLTRLVFPKPEIIRSSWVAIRHLPSAHTNPIKVIVDGKPIRASKDSAAWCLASVDQCWKQKANTYAEAEQAEARAAYEYARETYRRIMAESER